MAWSVELWPGEITVDRDNRQRRELPDIEGLADSIRRRGQLQPIVITRDNILVAGERRFAAISQLGDRPLRCVYTDEVDPGELQALEYEENSKRRDLSWQDNCRAVLNYHNYRLKDKKDWTASQTAEALGLSPAEISERLSVAVELVRGNKLVTEAPKLSTAKGIVKRTNERKVAAETSQLLSIASRPKVVDTQGNLTAATEDDLILDALEEAGTGYILNEDFSQWAPHYDGPKFNMIHCDFPYGIGMDKSDQGSGDSYGTYEDTPEVYWALIDTLINHLDNFCEQSAHLIFWFSMDYYQKTFDLLSTKFKVNPFPLVWVKTDNSGILPDANRGPRRTYETAFFASRGDRKIVRAVSNHVGNPIQRGKHMSEKPQAVLNHFFRMVVDEHSAVLDPTAGSGSAIRAAATSGASRYLGLELNPEFADHADEALKQHLEELSKK